MRQSFSSDLRRREGQKHERFSEFGTEPGKICSGADVLRQAVIAEKSLAGYKDSIKIAFSFKIECPCMEEHLEFGCTTP